MAFRLHLAPQAVNTLSHCPAAVREQVQHELGALLAAPLRDLVGWRATGRGMVLLRSGHRVLYQVDAARGLLSLLDVRAPAEVT